MFSHSELLCCQHYFRALMSAVIAGAYREDMLPDRYPGVISTILSIPMVDGSDEIDWMEVLFC